MHAPVLRAAAALLSLAAAASCARTAEPELGGEYLGQLDSPFSVEGAALIELHAPDIRSVSAPGRILVVRGSSERTLRVLLINPPRNQAGGPISFQVRMAKGAVPPRATVIAAAGPLNQARDFVGGYAVRFNRAEPSASLSPSAQRSEQPQTASPISFARLVAPFFPGGQPLTPPEQRLADRAGNSNQSFDLGDVRGYLVQYPSIIPPEAPWTR